MQSTFERLVVPVAGSENDARMLDILPVLLDREGGTVTFLYVVEVPQAMPLDAELPLAVDAGERALERAERTAASTLPSRSTKIFTELLQARAAGPAIVDEAVERNADAIIMTAAIHRKHGRPTLGETTDHVLLNAPCDVIVFRTFNPDQRLERPSAK